MPMMKFKKLSYFLLTFQRRKNKQMQKCLKRMPYSGKLNKTKIEMEFCAWEQKCEKTKE